MLKITDYKIELKEKPNEGILLKDCEVGHCYYRGDLDKVWFYFLKERSTTEFRFIVFRKLGMITFDFRSTENVDDRNLRFIPVEKGIHRFQIEICEED
jgi:hypothetical protein